ncbi:MAG TPA: AAA family ATPase [Gammaproteobacteria bacterium]|nr:AAA family ATPase [Gammaproteobacteria bacterium]
MRHSSKAGAGNASHLVSELTSDAALIAALHDPHCYPHPVARIEVVETHASWVLLTGEHAYKIKKPVNLGFLDYSTLAKRRAACTEELRLSRALAPELYLDVVPITGSLQAPVMNGAGAAIEYALHMRQFDRSQQLDALLAAGRLGERDMDSVADYVATFHLGAPRAAAHGPYGVPAELQAAVQDNFATLAPLLAGHYAAQLANLQAWSAAEYECCHELMESRRAQGWIRECHGDLHLANLARYGGRLLAFDRIEFDPALRWLDVLNDAAFLVMDLLARGRRDLAWRFLNGYLQHTGDYRGLPLLRYYLVYRALVRAKVILLKARQAGLALDLVPAEAERYLELASALIAPTRPRLVLMHGLSGSGKTWLSERLMTRLPAIRIRSDIERKRLHGLKPLARSGSAPGAHLYDVDTTAETYHELLALAEIALAAGYHVIVDAVFLERRQRRLFRELAARHGWPWLIIECRAPEILLRERLEARGALANDASEAGLAVLDYQLRSLETLDRREREHVIVVDNRTAPDFAAISARVLNWPQA